MKFRQKNKLNSSLSRLYFWWWGILVYKRYDMRKLTQEEFIEKAMAVHGDKYGYDYTIYLKSKEKINITCDIHGNFGILPNSHLAGQGCKSCGVETRASKQRNNNALFLEKAKEMHGDRYDYSKVEYYNSTTKVEIICKKHGSFLQTPKIHYKANCPECGRDSQIEKASKSTQKFVDEMVEKYGYKYDLSLVKYVNSKTPVKLICSVRGIIEVKPNELLSKQVYIRQGRKKTKSTDKEMFLKEVYKIYGDKNDYTSTKVGDSRGKIDVECKQHGKFTISMQGHFSGQDCPKCSAINYSKVRRLSTEEFIERAKKVHGESCDYTKTVYKTCNDKVVIKCKEHDTYFKVFPSNHIIGSKCKKCQSEKIKKALTGKEGTCGYTRTGYIKQANGREAKVYLIKCFSEEEEFYKIGKTFLDINIRFKKANLPYNFESVNFIFGEAGYIYDLEVEMHKIYREYKYKPKNKFAGYTECYKINLPIEEIKNMSNYVDIFIKDHKEYFLRNKSIIESNKWNETESTKDTVSELSKNLQKLQSKKTKEREGKDAEKELREYINNSSKTKKALFDQENKLTTSILGRLSDFINEAEGDRALQKTQDFIDFTVDIIKIHLDKARDYLQYNRDVLTKEDLTSEEVEYNDYEIVFQDDVFNKKMDIQNKLSNLNITNSVENFKLKLFKDQKSSLLMREPLILKNQDVKLITEKIPVDWGYTESIELLKNMKTSDIPTYNHKKHFYEQDLSTLQFWQAETVKITKGVTINGYWVHPWLYWHINIFKTPIPQPDGTEPTINPYLRDNEVFFCENLIRAEVAKNKGLLFYGTRRFTKSVILASYAQWKAFTKFNSVATITGGSEGDLTDLTSKIKASMDYMPPALRLEYIKQEWDGGDTLLGLKEDASNPIKYSTIRVRNLAAGAKTSTQKLAGGAPSAFVNDEIGKYDFLKGYLAALPSFETPFGFKCVPLLAGTAGESSLSDDAMTVLTNPQKYNLISMDWDRLSEWVDPEAISWKPRNFSLFVPAQMAYKDGFVKLEKKLGDFLKIKDAEELNKNIIQVTDWKGNLDKIVAWRKEAEGDSLLLQQRTVQYPISPEECFLSNEINPFPYEEAKLHREHLLETGKWDSRRKLVRGEDGKITAEISTANLVEYPFQGGNMDAPYLIIEEPDQENSPRFYYIASGDFYKQEKTSTTDSVGTVSIYKYPLFGDESGKKLVASYAARPKTYKEFNDNVFLLLEYYHASMFPENEDLGVFQTYLENKHLENEYLEKHIDFNSALQYTETDARKYGFTPKQSKNKLIAMYANYLNETIHKKNDYGESVSIKRVQTIDDIWLLSEIINYSESGNFDRISGNIGGIGFIHFLEKNYLYPKGTHRKRRDGDEEERPIQERKMQMYNTSRKRTFYR